MTKNFGHFSQIWQVEADSEEEAWEKAEMLGTLLYQTVYIEPFRKEDKGFVVDLDRKKKETPLISEEQYDEWLREAVRMGMIL